MKLRALFIPFILFFFNAIAVSAAIPADSGIEFHLENDFSVRSNHISGPGAESSYLTEGLNYLDILSVYGNGRVGDLRYDFSVGGKMTDDENYDIKQYSLTHFNVSLRSEGHQLRVGDVFPFFGDYALSSAIKGAAYKYDGAAAAYIPEMTVLYGLSAPRWDSLWGGSEVAVSEREVYGARLLYRLPAPLKAGINWVRSEDSDPAAPDDPMYDTTVCAVDWQFQPIPEFVLTGASALNATRLFSEAGTPADDELDGYALRFTGRSEGGALRVGLEYERVSPDFENPVGSAYPDREKVKLTGQYRFNESIQAYTNVLWFRDDLDNRKALGRTDVWRPEAGLVWQGLFHRPRASARLSCRREIADREEEDLEDNTYIKLNYKDHFGFLETDSNLGVNFRKQADETEDNEEFIYNTTLRSRLSAAGAEFEPQLTLGGWTWKDELSTAEDQARRCAFGLGIDLPFWQVTGSMAVGINDLDIHDADDSTRLFGNVNISWRMNSLAAAKEAMLYVKGTYNDFEYTSAAEDFREEQIIAGIQFKY